MVSVFRLKLAPVDGHGGKVHPVVEHPVPITQLYILHKIRLCYLGCDTSGLDK